MSEPSVDPGQVFHATLPTGTILIVLFVPSQDRNGETVDQQFWVDEVLTTLGQLYRGATAYPRGHGVWRDDEQGGRLILEEPVVVFSYVSDQAFTTASLRALYATLSRMGRQTKQGEVGVVIDGKYYGITQYAEV
jgi:hypothetical protein